MQETWETHWKDYYQILQVESAAETEVIKDSFEKLAKKFHPDVNKEPAALNRMKDLNVAFEVLSNPAKKAAYDSKYNKINRRGNKNINCPYSNQVKKPTNPPHDVKKSICYRKWVPCPRCINGNMYSGHDGESSHCLSFVSSALAICL
jgi:curved DNA-binding protein CbpA